MAREEVLAFDVNETLLDLRPLDALFDDGIRALPAHPDVPAALDRLRGAGRRMAALSNSPLDVSTAQLEHAGFADRLLAG